MLTNYLTGLSGTEEVVINSMLDEQEPRTEFVIKNLPGWGSLEVGRFEELLAQSGYVRNQAVCYGWVAFGLKEMRNVKEEGDVIKPPIETTSSPSGDKCPHIPISWLIKNIHPEVVSELAKAISTYNELSPGERKNFMWPLFLEQSEDDDISPVSGQEKGEQGNGIESAPSAVTAGSELKQNDGESSDLEKQSEDVSCLEEQKNVPSQPPRE